MRNDKDITLENDSVKQISDAERFCQILESVPPNQRSTVLAIAIAYMDGVIAGSNIKASLSHNKKEQEDE